MEGLILSALILLGILYFANRIPIAGSYVSVHALEDPLSISTIDISRSGKVITREVDRNGEIDMTISYSISNTKNGKTYDVNREKPITIEMIFPEHTINEYIFYLIEDLSVNPALTRKDNNDSVVISGDLTSTVASDLNMDINQFRIIDFEENNALNAYNTMYYLSD